VNDLGGTLMNESISTSAGAQHGQLMTPARLRAAIRAAGRLPAERNTKYQLLRTFGPFATEGEDASDPLDRVVDPDATFGSYVQLTKTPGFRFRRDASGHVASGTEEPRGPAENRATAAKAPA
jgi:FO synthase subunit 2